MTKRVPVRYEPLTVYGPFHRLTKADHEPARIVKLLLAKGELSGRGFRESPLPAAMAYYGALPTQASGVELYTLVEPDRWYGPVAYWHAPPFGNARGDGVRATIEVLIRRASKDCL
jgi:hypothetical protein